MEIKTKFNLGDTVVTVKDCKAVETKIDAIVITTNGVSYGTDTFSAVFSPLKEECCFASKDELIKNLTNGQTE